MKTDLIERLRAHAEGRHGLRMQITGAEKIAALLVEKNDLLHEAADRIAALESAVADLDNIAASAFTEMPDGSSVSWEELHEAECATTAHLRSRIAALEAEASEGERRGLERAAEVADAIYRDWIATRDEGRMSKLTAQTYADMAFYIAGRIRALIPEAPVREGE